MATLTLSNSDRRIESPEAVAQFLEPFGIHYEHWPVEGRLSADATNDDILAEYAPEIEQLKQSGGYVTADVINVAPDTPGLDEMLAKFDKEHTHSEDEVRFTVEGRGVFWIHAPGSDQEEANTASVFSIEVEAGDLINVPAGTQHWFHLCDDRHIRCIRLFQDPAGWTPDYMEGGIATDHPPVCWGRSYLAGKTEVKPVVQL